MVVELVASRKSNFLHIDGFLYYYRRESKGRTYWKCKKCSECSATAITSSGDAEIIVHKGPDKSPHIHAPDLEAVNALKIVNKLKRVATEHPEAPPAQVLRNELHEVPSGTFKIFLNVDYF